MSHPTGKAYQIDQLVTARVDQIFPFGVFVHLPDGTRAYVRKRELTLARNLDPRQVVSEGQEIGAVVVALEEPGRNLELSVRQAMSDPWEAFARSFRVRDTITAEVKGLFSGGALVQVIPGIDGFIPSVELAPWRVEKPGDLLWVGDSVEAMITNLDPQRKRLRLSIRRQMVHMALVHSIARQLQAEDAPLEPVLEPDETQVEEEEAIDLRALGRVLVLDDHAGVRQELVVWLRRYHCQADGVERPDDALAGASNEHYSLALVDLDLAGQDGVEFIRALQANSPDTQVIVISIPEWIAERSYDLEALRVLEVLTKPLNMDEVRETLHRLALGEVVGPFRVTTLERVEERMDSFHQLAQTMRDSTLLTTRFEAGLEELVRLTQAELGVLFHLDPISRQISIVVQSGHLPLNHAAVYALTASPVKDLILEGGTILEPQLSDQTRRRFQNLLELVSFEACLGVPVSAAGRVEHALFLFHRKPGAFTPYRLRDARAMATLLGVALESRALEERVKDLNPFLLSGKLAAGLGHDVFNKMSALELQVRNLRAQCDGLVGEGDTGNPDQPYDRAQVSDDIDRLLETTLDLKQTVNAFRGLTRAEDQVAIDVNLVVQQAVLLLQAIARRHRVRIKTALASDLPPVAGSAVRLEQALFNVMLNAIQHTARKFDRWPEGRANLCITTVLDPCSERPVHLRFEDNGPGIHRKLWEKIFRLGFSTRPGGTGLGLFIARCLVESVGGVICVEQSLIPSGTTFRIELPVAACEG